MPFLIEVLMKNSMKMQWFIVGGLFIALGAVAVYKAWPLLFPEVAIIAPLDPECDLRAGPCISELPGGGSVSLSITPDSIPLIKPLTLQVELKGIESQGAEIDFQGLDMNMGFNRPKLMAEGEGRFVGKGILPVCVRETMEWEAKVLVRTERGLIAAPFRFITVKSEADLPK